MPIKIPKTDESQLNMTPMIDIVFQLILFFLFSLKFNSLDYRIESNLPKDRGIEATGWEESSQVEEIEEVGVGSEGTSVGVANRHHQDLGLQVVRQEGVLQARC